MDSVAQVYPVGSNDVQVEVVTSEGHPVTTRPIHMEELLRQQDHTLDVGEGIALRLEELNAQQSYSDEDDDDDEDNDSAESASTSSRDDENNEGATKIFGRDRAGPPPGTHATNEWYDVLDALRREQHDVERTAAEVAGSLRKPQEGEGRLVTRNPNSKQNIATSLKRFSNLPGTETRSITDDRRSPVLAPGTSRRDVWASLAPPKDAVPHNYSLLRYVSYMSALDYRRFRPTALTFHAAASYLNRKDRGQRFLVYGGLSFGARKVEQELYEFFVLTGNWRRMEGKQLVPAGHYGHTMTVVEPLDRVVVIGGIGPGGAMVSKAVKETWLADPLRATRYSALCPLLRRGGLIGGALGICASTTRPVGSTTCAAGGAGAASSTSIGFVSLLFDMNLGDLAWRAIQPAQPFPLAYHTAVHFEKVIYVFGGLTDELRVSGQLLAINPETYAVRLISPPSSTRGSTRSRHGRSESAKSGTSSRDGGARAGTVEDEAGKTAATNTNIDDNDEEAAGPGPRFLHTAVRYGPYMIVYGGYNTHNEVLSDCWAFDMVNERWERLRCRCEEVGRAGHECCVVGCRMMVTGGFSCTLEEAAGSATTATATPATTVMELNLVPTAQGEHLWRNAVKVHPALPPLAFTRCAPCGEDHSFLLFGGLTNMPRRSRPKSNGRRSESAKRRGGDDSGSDDDDGAVPDSQDGAGGYEGASRVHEKHTHGSAAAEGYSGGHKGLLSHFAPFDDGLVFTFPVKQLHKRRSGDEPVVNALGVEVDPNELPEHFKTFVRRQEDFIKKRDAAVVNTMRKTTLEEQEGMEPTLYLTDDEIDLLIQRGEDCCVTFAQRYHMSTLPSNVPDREERVRLIEECISESRQVRDVLKSMKGSALGVTAVKSKSHRKRAGQKFEDYSAAKPFRRVVVMHLIEGINSHLARMHHLNKALRTVDWEDKANFLEAVNDMQNAVHAVSRAINGVMHKYIQHRVDSLMKGVDKHREVMRLLTQVVEKNLHDKIWGVEEARDKQRHQCQRAKAVAPSPETRSVSRVKRTASSGKGDTKTGTTVHRSRSLGGGHHADESKAVVYLMDREWNELLARTQAVEKCAEQLRRYCQDGMSLCAPFPTAKGGGVSLLASTAATNVAPPVATVPDSGLPSLPIPQVGAFPVVSTAAAAPASGPSSLQPPSLVLQPPQLSAPQVTVNVQSGLPLPTLAIPSPALPTTTNTEDPSAAAAPAVPSLSAPDVNGVGAARPRDILIRHSDELRAKTAAVAEEVGVAAATFYSILTQNDVKKTGGENVEGSASSSSPSVSQLANQQVADVSSPVSQPVPPPPVTSTVDPAGAGGTANDSSRGSRSSSAATTSSDSASSAFVTPQTLGTAPVQNVPLPTQLLTAPALCLPSPATAAIGLPGTAGHSAPHVTVSTPHDENDEASRQEKQHQLSNNKTKDKVVPMAVAGGHAMYLGSLRPLLASKDAFMKLKDRVSLIRKNVWDVDDPAGAPQDVKVEELYRRLERLITSVAQSVTASFLSKAGARPPRVRPASRSVVAPPPRTKSQKSRQSGRGGSVAQPGLHPAVPVSITATSEMPGHHSSPAVQQLALSRASAPRREGSANNCVNGNGDPDCGTAGGLLGAGEVLRLRPLITSAASNDEDWWKTPSNPAGATEAHAAAATTAAPLVPTDALLRDVRLASVTPSPEAAAKLSIQPVFKHTITVPNADVTASAAAGETGVSGNSTQCGSYAIKTESWTQHPAAVVSLSLVPKVLMPQSVDATSSKEDSSMDNRRSSIAASPTQPVQRRTSTVEELTQLPSAGSPVGAAAGGLDASVGAGPAVSREPITSITGGNFTVNTEYLYRAAPYTIPVGVSHITGTNDSVSGDAVLVSNNTTVDAGKYAWADVDDEYFYFGRPAEHRVAVGDTVVNGPPYVAVAPALSTGQVGISPAVGSVVGTQRVNVELATAHRSSATRRSVSRRRDGEGYRTLTASVAQKAQTARSVRRDGSNAKSFYTPGELQLMQARERLRAKPQKH